MSEAPHNANIDSDTLSSIKYLRCKLNFELKYFTIKCHFKERLDYDT